MSFDLLAGTGPFPGGPEGSAESPILSAIRAFEPILKPWAAVDLSRLWHFDLRGLDPEALHNEIGRRIDDPEWSSYRRDHPEPGDRLRSVLERFGPELTPDAPARLTGLWYALSTLGSSYEIEEQVAARLGTPAFRAYLRPGIRPPSTGLEALRAALARHAPRLRPGATHDLEIQWTPLVAALPPARVAGLVARLLDDPRNARLLGSGDTEPDPIEDPVP